MSYNTKDVPLIVYYYTNIFIFLFFLQHHCKQLKLFWSSRSACWLKITHCGGQLNISWACEHKVTGWNPWSRRNAGRKSFKTTPVWPVLMPSTSKSVRASRAEVPSGGGSLRSSHPARYQASWVISWFYPRREFVILSKNFHFTKLIYAWTLPNTTNFLWLNLSKVKETLHILTGRTGYKPLCGRLPGPWASR